MLKRVNQLTIDNCEKFMKEILNFKEKPRVLVIGGGEKGDGTKKLWMEKKDRASLN